MLDVVDPKKADELLFEHFGALRCSGERISLERGMGRVLAEPVLAQMDIPSFARSQMDGYAVRAADTFGCSESLPAMMTWVGEIEMGQLPERAIALGECMSVPTGGALPVGCDAIAMVEYAQRVGQWVTIHKSVAPGEHVTYRGDDVRAGSVVAEAGIRLKAHHIGALAAAGARELSVSKRPLVAIISTGDELCPPDQALVGAQVYDVNGPVLCAAIEAAGGEGKYLGIQCDDEEQLFEAAQSTLTEVDMLILSGGSSVGIKDATARVLDRLGKPGLFLHGIAIRPGKPTLAADIGGKPVIGLPGHPVSSHLVFLRFVLPLLRWMQGERVQSYPIRACLSENIPNRTGRESWVPVELWQEQDKLMVRAVPMKSGLITTLSRAQGMVCVPRECEGEPAGAMVDVWQL